MGVRTAPLYFPAFTIPYKPYASDELPPKDIESTCKLLRRLAMVEDMHELRIRVESALSRLYGILHTRNKAKLFLEGGNVVCPLPALGLTGGETLTPWSLGFIFRACRHRDYPCLVEFLGHDSKHNRL